MGFFLFLHIKNQTIMKFRNLLSLFALSTLIFISCSDDNNSTNDNVITNPDNENGGGNGSQITVLSEWIPADIQLIKIIPLQTFDYPHQEGCEQDVLQLLSNNSGKFLRHLETSCTLETYEQAFSRSGDQVTLNLSGYTITGTLQETDTQMIITSGVDAYIPFIQAMYPDAEQYLSLLEGATIKLTLNKKV